MHYRNGREAKNGDKIVMIESGKIVAKGILYDAVAGNDYCNGNMIDPDSKHVSYACLCDCLHEDDIAEILREKGLDERPKGM